MTGPPVAMLKLCSFCAPLQGHDFIKDGAWAKEAKHRASFYGNCNDGRDIVAGSRSTVTICTEQPT